MTNEFDENDQQSALRIPNSAMPPPQSNSSPTALSALKRFVRPRNVAVERCELCAAELGAEHPHLVEPASRQLLCACQPCAILFSGHGDMKYRRVPRRIRYLSDFQLTDAQWESLLLPIGMAFFFHSSPADKVIALYPSPAGATESLLDLESWEDLVETNPVLKEIEPDVEALLVNRVGAARDYFLAPIDECYKLVGMIRSRWHGLSGGTEVWEGISEFFRQLEEKASK
jgi:hypothetical protein